MGGLVVTLYFILTGSSRSLKEQLLPNLLRALRPLRPNPQEIDEAIEAIRLAGYRLAKNLKTQAIVERLRTME